MADKAVSNKIRKARPSDITKECEFCGTAYPCRRYEQSSSKYCSKACRVAWHAKKLHSKTCVVCGAAFSVVTNRKNFAKYCSRRCSGAALRRKSLVTVKCSHCGKDFHRQAAMLRRRRAFGVFCSRKCHYAHRLKTDTAYPASVRAVLKNHGQLHQCERCKYDKFPDILQVHHRDRNPRNNEKSNIEVLCPNCHNEEHFLTGKVLHGKRTAGHLKQNQEAR